MASNSTNSHGSEMDYTTGRRARALRSILSFTFLLSIFAVTHANANCRKRASSALTSDGVRRSSALDQASVSWTSKAAWTCVRALCDGGAGDASTARRWRRRARRRDHARRVRAARGAGRADAAVQAKVRGGVGRALCVWRATGGAPSWLGREDAGAHTFCFMSDGTLAPAARVARCCWGRLCVRARGRAAAALLW